MLPVVAIVGRPNVGKSTLFNRLTRSRDALVVDIPGVTRDRQYGEGKVGPAPYIVVDTGGITGNDIGVDGAMADQVQCALDEADIILFMVDGRDGLTSVDQALARQLRIMGKTAKLIVNKTDGADPDVQAAEFYELGLGEAYPIAAVHNRGVRSLMDEMLEGYEPPEEDPEWERTLKLAIVGRPNVGKSTLVNRMLGEDRVVVFDMPGTTTDSIYTKMERDGTPYTIIDTAGVRKRGKVTETLEKFSVIKTLKAIEDSNVVLVLIDGRQGLSDQDLSLLGFAMDAGKAIVMAVNKWDGLSGDERVEIKRELERRLEFMDYADMHFISALHGSGVGVMWESIDAAYECATRELSTSLLTRILEQAVVDHQPPMVYGRRIKLRYAHSGGRNPPIIVIHGNQTASLPKSYLRYLQNYFRKSLEMVGTPIRIEMRGGENPYADKKNALSARQKQTLKKYQDNIRPTRVKVEVNATTGQPVLPKGVKARQADKTADGKPAATAKPANPRYDKALSKSYKGKPLTAKVKKETKGKTARKRK
ncbi:ribosome biogenesis GTPase Der [Pelagibaculum spongiae]|uniref:GTPase Der n=2 Tax=Pelagibaculum spongiae TaxID=2080658 RepID=A0A2V1H0Y3_9GAMM|nr:ribosome biogenesis GTPase Der [Pelagibaculum spongiae]PVZ72329.1 ribosome biogenesis GTPase Der [Pelagibaculum spongiae]